MVRSQVMIAMVRLKIKATGGGQLTVYSAHTLRPEGPSCSDLSWIPFMFCLSAAVNCNWRAPGLIVGTPRRSESSRVCTPREADRRAKDEDEPRSLRFRYAPARLKRESMWSITSFVSFLTTCRAGSASNHASVFLMPTWKGIVALKSGTILLILVLSKITL
jgi:hypothetical protein